MDIQTPPDEFDRALRQAAEVHHSQIQALRTENRVLEQRLNLVRVENPDEVLSCLSMASDGEDVFVEACSANCHGETLGVFQQFSVEDLNEGVPREKNAADELMVLPAHGSHTSGGELPRQLPTMRSYSLTREAGECSVGMTSAEHSFAVTQSLMNMHATPMSSMLPMSVERPGPSPRRSSSTEERREGKHEQISTLVHLTKKIDKLTLQTEESLKLTKAIHKRARRNINTKRPAREVAAGITHRKASTMSEEFKDITSNCSGVSDMMELTRRIITQRSVLSQRQTGMRFSVWRFLEDRNSSTCAFIYSYSQELFHLLAFFFAGLQAIELKGTLDPRGTFVSTAQVAIECLFAAEFAIRAWACPHKAMFLSNVYNIIDLLSSFPLLVRVPLLVSKAAGSDLSDSDFFQALLGLVPTLRLLKPLRNFNTFQLLLRAFRETVEALPVLLYLIVFMCFSFASLLYYLEPRHNIPSFAEALYFVVVTVSTVGYGDFAPVSIAGRTASCVLIVIGPLYMAIPFGIVGMSFSKAWEDRHRVMLMQRIRACVTTAGYSPDDMQIMFDILDTDQSGDLEYHEFRSMIDIMDIEVEEQYILDVFDTLDDDDVGSLNLPKIIRGLFPEGLLFLGGRMSSARAALSSRQLSHVPSTSGSKGSGLGI